MAKIQGNDFVVTGAITEAGTQELFLHANSCSIDHTNAVIDVTTRDNDSASEYLSGRTSYTLSVDGVIDYDDASTASLNSVELFDLAQTGATIFWVSSGSQIVGTGRVTYSGQAIITSFSQTGASDETATYSMSLQGTGLITKTTAA